jgi:hypothetical protein
MLLGANVLAAVLGGLALSGHAGRVAAYIATVAFVVGVLVASWLAIERPNRRWYAARAAAESAKTLATQYAVGGGEFEVSDLPVDASYRSAIAAIPDSLRHLPPLGYLADPVTAGLVELRALPLDERRAVYVQERLEAQKRWYGEKAQYNDRRALAWRSVMVVGQVVGVVGGLLRATETWDVNLLGIAAAVTAAAAAWAQTKEHEGLAEAYSVTQRELEKVTVGAATPVTEGEWAEYVSDAESAVSREHTLWVARRLG